MVCIQVGSSNNEQFEKNGLVNNVKMEIFLINGAVGGTLMTGNFYNILRFYYHPLRLLLEYI